MWVTPLYIPCRIIDYLLESAFSEYYMHDYECPSVYLLYIGKFSLLKYFVKGMKNKNEKFAD